MIRLLTIMICAALIAAGIVWIANRQGDLMFTVDGYQLRTSASVAIGFAILFSAFSAFSARLVALVLGGPGAFGRWSTSRRNRRGNEALSRGLVAAAAGDSNEARRHAKKAGSLLGAPPLSLLLTAQAAQLDGDERGQTDAYHAMLAHPETEFLGLRGLFMQAMRREDSEQAMTLAARAHALKPRAAWAANALFDLKSARRLWSDAKTVLESAARAKLVDPGLARRRRAVLLTAEALDYEGRGEGERALAASLEALNLSPGLAPAAALAAHKLSQAGRAWRAQDIIEAAWAQAPHPDLASAYAAIKPGEDAETRALRLRGLAQLNRDHFESRMVEAEQAINLARWAEARRVLAPLAQAFATTRVCALMAEIEQGERHDAAAAHSWLSRAVRAPRDADWRCGNCGWNTPDWHAVCGNCGAFDTLAWSAPSADTLEMMPGAAHDERLGMDSTPPSFLQAPGEIEENTDRVLAPSRTPWRKDGDTMGESERGFVILSRPPDDPGPGGYDFDPEPVVPKRGKFMRRFLIGVAIVAALLVGGYCYFSVPEIPRATLEVKYATPPSQFLTLADGARVHFRDRGPKNAPVLVLIHGSNASLFTWEPWTKRLDDSFRVVAIDMPGHGLTGAVPSNDYSQAGMVEFTKNVVDKIGLGKFAIAGNSMGGGVAARFAEEYPDRITALILVDAGGMPSKQGDHVPLGFRIGRIPVLNKLLLHLAPRAMFKEGLNDSVVHKGIVTDAMVDQYWELNRMEGTPEATLARFNEPFGTYIKDHIGQIKAPTLILWGAEDHLIPVEAAHAYNAAIPGSKLIVYPAAGHILQEDAADQSAVDVRAFLGRMVHS